MKKFKANDYLGVTRSYLRRYNLYAQYLNNVKDSVDEIDSRLATESISVSRYGTDPGGGGSELSAVERAAAERIILEQEKNELANNASEVMRLMHRVSSTISTLPEEEQAILRGHYLEGRSCTQLAMVNNYSERWCRKLLRQAESKMAVMLFGPKAAEDIFFIK